METRGVWGGLEWRRVSHRRQVMIFRAHYEIFEMIRRDCAFWFDVHPRNTQLCDVCMPHRVRMPIVHSLDRRPRCATPSFIAFSFDLAPPPLLLHLLPSNPQNRERRKSRESRETSWCYSLRKFPCIGRDRLPGRPRSMKSGEMWVSGGSLIPYLMQ